MSNLHEYLHEYRHSLPDIQCASADHCSLFPVDKAFVFTDAEINMFVGNLFATIHTATAHLKSIPQVLISSTIQNCSIS